MKKLFFTFCIVSFVAVSASAQVLPSFQFGLKGGANLSNFSTTNTFASSNQAGYLAGVWARFGALGFNFQPELYYTSKDVKVTDNGSVYAAKFRSVDLPLLFGGKFGAVGIGGRFYTGPVASFAVDKTQSFGAATGNALAFNYHDANFAWQFGAGVDIQRISVDLRYEAGITKQPYVYGSSTGETRVNLFSLSLAYRLFSL